VPARQRAGGIEKSMFTLHIEHAVTDFDAWKRMFDSDPLNRKTAGVTGFRVLRPVDDTHTVRIDLEFDSRPAAEAMRAALENLWQGPAGDIMRNPSTRLTETVEAVTL
jgi:hypothetical protein